MTKKETFKWIVQIIASIATAILRRWERYLVSGTKQKKSVLGFDSRTLLLVENKKGLQMESHTIY